MSDHSKNVKPKKSLGQDPLADLEGLELGEMDVTPRPPASFREIELPVTPEPPPEVFEDETVEVESHLLDDIIATIDEEITRSFNLGITAGEQIKPAASPQVDQEQYILFTLAGVEYAAPAANVREVGEIVNLTTVPNTPEWLLGVTNLRGDILSVVDLRVFLDLPPAITPDLPGMEQEMLIVHPRQDASLITTGLLVETVNDIRYLVLDRINPPSGLIEDKITPYLKGVYEEEQRLLIVLDFDRLLLSPALRQFEAV